MNTLPIDSLSYSRMRLYLTSKVMFWRKYVTKDYETSRSATMVEGSIIHRLMEQCVADAIRENGGTHLRTLDEAGLGHLVQEYVFDEYPTITYMGSSKLTPALMEKHAAYVMENFVRHINGWIAQGNQRRFTHVEYPMRAFIKDTEGMSFPVPFVARVDALSIERTDEGTDRLTVHDWKIVRSTSDETTAKNTFMYMFQQLPYWLVSREEFPHIPELRVAYHFHKATESRPKKGTPAQTAVKSVVMTPPSAEDIQAFCFLVELMLRDVRGLQGPRDAMPILLPNVYDDISGRANWELFKKTYQDFILPHETIL